MRAGQRLEFAQARLVDHFEWHAIGLPPRVKLIELGELLR